MWVTCRHVVSRAMYMKAMMFVGDGEKKCTSFVTMEVMVLLAQVKKRAGVSSADWLGLQYMLISGHNIDCFPRDVNKRWQ